MKVTITFGHLTPALDDEVEVEYVNGESLTPDQLAKVMVPLLNDTLGEEPAIGDVLAIQRGMMQAMN